MLDTDDTYYLCEALVWIFFALSQGKAMSAIQAELPLSGGLSFVARLSTSVNLVLNSTKIASLAS